VRSTKERTWDDLPWAAHPVLGGHLKTGHHGRGDRDRQLLIESLSSGLLFFSL
jgi:hypothetical protein